MRGLIVDTITNRLIRQVKDEGKRNCIECRSPELEYFERVYIQGELFSFPYCKNCGLVQWHVVSGFHLSLEKLYELYLKLVENKGMSDTEILSDLEYIKKRKGDEGYSDDVVILKEIFLRARC